MLNMRYDNLRFASQNPAPVPVTYSRVSIPDVVNAVVVQPEAVWLIRPIYQVFYVSANVLRQLLEEDLRFLFVQWSHRRLLFVAGAWFGENKMYRRFENTSSQPFRHLAFSAQPYCMHTLISR
jgi:hypothetical protein